MFATVPQILSQSVLVQYFLVFHFYLRFKVIKKNTAMCKLQLGEKCFQEVLQKELMTEHVTVSIIRGNIICFFPWLTFVPQVIPCLLGCLEGKYTGNPHASFVKQVRINNTRRFKQTDEMPSGSEG